MNHFRGDGGIGLMRSTVEFSIRFDVLGGISDR